MRDAYRSQQIALQEFDDEWCDPAPEALHSVGSIDRLGAVLQMQGSVQSGYRRKAIGAALTTLTCGCELLNPGDVGSARCDLVRVHAWRAPPGLMVFGIVSILAPTTHRHRLDGAATLLGAMERELIAFGVRRCCELVPAPHELLEAIC
jgi:hypothetical protein